MRHTFKALDLDSLAAVSGGGSGTFIDGGIGAALGDAAARLGNQWFGKKEDPNETGGIHWVTEHMREEVEEAHREQAEDDARDARNAGGDE